MIIKTTKDLKGKFINIEGISENLFNKIIAKMERIGFKRKSDCTFKKMKNGYGYFYLQTILIGHVSLWACSQGRQEISIEDFLREEFITLEEFKKEKIVINTRIQEEYDNLMRFFDSKGIMWGNDKASRNKVFHFEKEKTCIEYDNDPVLPQFRSYRLEYCDKDYYVGEGYKIITPNELAEYNEFMGKTTRPERKCEQWEPVWISLEYEYLTIGQAIDYMLESEENVIIFDWEDDKKLKLRMKDYCQQCIESTYNSWVDTDIDLEHWKNIRKHIEPKQKTLKELIQEKELLGDVNNCDYDFGALNKWKAIEYMLKSDDNVVECFIIPRKFDYFHIKEGVLRGTTYGNPKLWIDMPWKDFIDSKLTKFFIIKKESEKTLRERIKSKEPFKYNDNWYRFNKDGAVIDSVGGAISLDKIKELLNIDKSKTEIKPKEFINSVKYIDGKKYTVKTIEENVSSRN